MRVLKDGVVLDYIINVVSQKCLECIHISWKNYYYNIIMVVREYE